MKRILFVVGLMLVSANTLADDTSMQMVLDSVHSKGFTGCDQEIRESFSHVESLSHVETKSLFGKKANDEVEVIYGLPGNSQYDWDSSIHSVIIRKVGKQCLFAESFSVVSSINRDCTKVANAQMGGSYVVVSKADGSFWVRMAASDQDMDKVFAMDGAGTIYTPLNGAGCRTIGLPTSKR